MVDIAQLGEHLVVVQGVTGSIPVIHQTLERWQSWSIESDLKSEVLARVPWVRILLSPPKYSFLAQRIRAFRYGRRGWGFESLRDYYWKITQVGEGACLLNK